MILNRRRLIYGLGTTAAMAASGIGFPKAEGTAAASQPKSRGTDFGIVLHGMFLLDFRGPAGLDVYSPDCSACHPPHTYQAGSYKQKLLTPPGFCQPAWSLDPVPARPSNLAAKLTVYPNFKVPVANSGKLALRLPFPSDITPYRLVTPDPQTVPLPLQNSIFPLVIRLVYPNPPESALFNDPNFDGTVNYHIYAEPSCTMDDNTAAAHAKESWGKLLAMMGNPNDLDHIPTSARYPAPGNDELKSLDELNGSPPCGQTGGVHPLGTQLPTCIPLGTP